MHIHAHLIIAPSIGNAAIAEDLKNPSIDVHHIIVENFGIEDARVLTTIAGKRPMSGTYRSFVVCTSAMTREAQNALLKLLEEPPQSSVFYIVIPHVSILLPTLRSRLIQTTAASDIITTEPAAEFLKLSIADRLATIVDMQKKKDSAGMQMLVQTIGALVTKNSAEFSAVTLQTLLFVESRVRMKGASKKMLLEHLALSLPVTPTH
ncbi:MAG: hypothetical protein WDZ68_01175 [Candidatus Paceibacterota bacterium]